VFGWTAGLFVLVLSLQSGNDITESIRVE